MRHKLFGFLILTFCLVALPARTQEVLLSTPLHYQEYSATTPLVRLTPASNQTGNPLEVYNTSGVLTSFISPTGLITGPVSTGRLANNGATGTTLYTLTKLTGAPSAAIIAALTDNKNGAVIGITVAGAGTTGSATIQQFGPASCVFDGATTAGDFVTVSTATAGNCHDAGSAQPADGSQIVGRVLSTNGAGGTFTLNLGSLANTPYAANTISTALSFAETVAPAAALGSDILYADSTAHAIKASWNNGAFVAIPQLAGDLAGTSASPTVASSHFTSAPTPNAAAGVGIGTAALPFSNLILGTAATNVYTITPAAAGAARILTIPDPGAAASFSYMAMQDCTTTAACANTVKAMPIMVRGSVAFPTATTVSLSQLPFTSNTSYSCIAGDRTTAAGIINATTYTSGAAVTFTETNGVNTDTASYVCVGF